jgi:hypothetical protein
MNVCTRDDGDILRHLARDPHSATNNNTERTKASPNDAAHKVQNECVSIIKDVN